MNRRRKFLHSESGIIPMLLALLLAAGAVIGFGAYILKGSTVALQSNKSNYEQLVDLEKTIRAYTFLNRVLPCPAAPNGDGASKTSCASNENDGVVPWATLGITRAAATDPYGRLISYHVDPALAPVNPNNLNICQSTTARPGTLVLSPTTAVSLFVLISHGPNGLGGWRTNSLQMPNPASTQERENCADITGNNSIVTCVNPSATIVTQGPHQTDLSQPNYFDDMLLAATSANYNPVCANGGGGGGGNDRNGDGIPDHCQDGRGNDDNTPACRRYF